MAVALIHWDHVCMHLCVCVDEYVCFVWLLH